jgi:hypothetical protein
MRSRHVGEAWYREEDPLQYANPTRFNLRRAMVNY